ncbi:MAG: class I SAM-dependent rRNA methyltransferase [Gammaproteobacteria bacterium]|nr:class I SAM-dependent rRNA methyltransferase [Gammaproteobacteria bacterium]
MSKTLVLRRGEERRVQVGHLWVFSNEVDIQKTPLKEFQPGETATLLRFDGKKLGTVYVNPNSLICARLISALPEQKMDKQWFKHRLQQALALREQMYDQPYYRLVFSEGDFMPGLILDRYGDYFVAQLNTAAMDRARDELIAVCCEMFQPKGITLRNDSGSRAQEQLAESVEVVYGQVPEELTLLEDGAEFAFAPLSGQKTGWFYDQRHNRQSLKTFAKDKTCLDLFSYVGGWSIQMGRAGAREVVAVDASQPAIDRVLDNAKRNGLDSKISALCGDVFEILKQFKQDGRTFDLIVVDPPAFIKRKKDEKEGALAYQRANRLAMEILNPGGILVSCSCSHHFSAGQLQRALLKGAGQLRREMQILEIGQQSPDHPIHPAIPETSYLKGFYCRLL